MPTLPMNQLGAIETVPGTIQFGVFLPTLNPANTASVAVCVLAEADAIIEAVTPVSLALTHAVDPVYGDYWSGTLTVAAVPPPPGSTSGAGGTYVYWYTVTLASGQVIDRLVDPFAREFGFKDYSAITVGYVARPWAATEISWRTPPLSELIVYEIELNEFGGGIVGSTAMLPYLKSLGVTAVEVMPVTNVATVIDWGYSPLAYFGVDERFGNRADFQAFVEAAHANGLAVILDVVYGHTDTDFLYSRLYAEANLPNPVMNPHGTYGPTPLYTTALMGDLFYTANSFWLSTFHIDGFRYDNVEAFLAYFPGLAQATYQLVVAMLGAVPVSPDWSRFSPPAGADIPLVQCPEYLSGPPSILSTTFATCAWQDDTLGAAVTAANGNSLYALGLQSGLEPYPASATVGGVTLAKSAMQYVENHDHQRFICNYGVHLTDNLKSPLLQEGNRTDDPNGTYVGKWFAVQPYLILCLLGKGVPFLWQAQEIGENYYVPTDGLESGRVRIFRPVRWKYADDLPGQSLARLTRSLIQIRRRNAQFKTGLHFFENDFTNYQSKGLLLFRRWLGAQWSLVALNFTGSPQTSTYAFPNAGTYAEQIDGPAANLVGVVAGAPQPFTVPSNYGRVWTSP
jgi:maltooligosyltrehalose trehalohydrolase